MNTSWLLILIPIIEIGATIPYILDILKGKTHPEIATWVSWFFVATLASVVSWSNHLYPSAVFATALMIECGIILVLAKNKHSYSHTKYDVLCLLGVLLGTLVWLLTDNALFAIIAIVLSDFIAAFPTYIHSWKSPDEETALTFAITIFVNILMIIAITENSFLELAQPVYLFLVNTSIVFIILYRKSIVHLEKDIEKEVKVIEKEVLQEIDKVI